MYYLTIGKKIISKVLTNPHNYELKLSNSRLEGFLSLKTECADTQIFRELFPRLQSEVRDTVIRNHLR